MALTREPVELLEKNRPRQERAKRTYESILASAAELLIEVGVERISTNLIAERAGITVPALYRYFPNKYSVLHALGAALMDRQNAVFETWFAQYGVHGSAEDLLAAVQELMQRTYEVTASQTGGLEILQSLRAVAPLQQVRLESHRLVSEQFGHAIVDLLGWERDASLELAARVSVESGYSAVEMALESGELEPQDILAQGAKMIQLYWRDIVQSR